MTVLETADSLARDCPTSYRHRRRIRLLVGRTLRRASALGLGRLLRCRLNPRRIRLPYIAVLRRPLPKARLSASSAGAPSTDAPSAPSADAPSTASRGDPGGLGSVGRQSDSKATAGGTRSSERLPPPPPFLCRKVRRRPRRRHNCRRRRPATPTRRGAPCCRATNSSSQKPMERNWPCRRVPDAGRAKSRRGRCRRPVRAALPRPRARRASRPCLRAPHASRPCLRASFGSSRGLRPDIAVVCQPCATTAGASLTGCRLF